MKITLTILGIGLFFLLITWVAILDIARKDFGGIEKKAAWALFVALVPFIGCAVYYLVGFRKGKKPTDIEPSTSN